MTIWLVRHAKAGERRKWSGADEQRPLSKVGRRQAEALVKTILDSARTPHITRIVSSPHVRCRQTVEPLAEELQLPVETSDMLAEGASLADGLRLIRESTDGDAVLCTHGDELGVLLAHFEGKRRRHPKSKLPKGAVWMVDIADGESGKAKAITYLPPRPP